ncbi:Uncharacterised protein [Bordetella pertussis]|nr:Uncharacterised protein [Bordetella pertussis]CFP65310.1 Uncharacterised protein [Bordetella pertussis]
MQATIRASSSGRMRRQPRRGPATAPGARSLTA